MQHIPLSKKVLKQWLKAGYLEKKHWFPTEKGTPQGGIISPTIANMVLDEMEAVIYNHAHRKRNRNPHKINFVRYADDFVVTCNSSEYLETDIKPLISRFLAERGLELSAEKTKITHIVQGFDFLGFNIRKYKGKCLTKPNREAIKDIYSSIRDCANNHKAVTQIELIRMIAPKIKGWANFFRHSCAKHTFSQLDNKVFKLLWKWAKRRHPNKGDRWVKAKYFKSIAHQNWVFATRNNGKLYKLPLFDATSIIRHIKVKSSANPFDKDWDDYFIGRELKSQPAKSA
jgi:RNA-directed DNA polymerase